MSGFSLKKLISTICFKPLANWITSKVAFHPPEPTYTLQETEASQAHDLPPVCKLHLSESANWPYSQQILDEMETFYCTTKHGNRLSCMYIRCAPGSRYTILYSHANACDLGEMCSSYYDLGSKIGCNIFSYDYSGYGASSGKPSEENLYADIEAAWHALRTRYGVPAEKIVLYGQSIGTAAAVDLATRYKCAAVILHSPLMSGLRVFSPNIQRTCCCDPFPSINKISKVTCPVLIIHGTEDEIVDFSHGLGLYERCPNTVMPLWVKGGGHNDLETFKQYIKRLQYFFYKELPTF
ncbi:alpha/beta hydrolase domain-containing protein 17C-like [Pseudophryne corroboree]|uniref:alpha/beta hydrolase domain-containing protein 17C-like n=1 Tax=Pseudophryne corroboree TaxID=495146 RepID=UPI003081FFEF